MNGTRIKTIIRYGIRLVPVVVVVVALAWFLWLRPSGDQDKTSGTGHTGQNTPETTASTDESTTTTQPEEKVAASGDTLAATTSSGSKSGLPDTGPGDTLALFAVTTVAGTLFWEWRTRRKRYNN